MDALVSHLVILGRFLGKYPLERWIIGRLWSWALRNGIDLLTISHLAWAPTWRKPNYHKLIMTSAENQELATNNRIQEQQNNSDVLANTIENTWNTTLNVKNTSENFNNHIGKQHIKISIILAVIIPHTHWTKRGGHLQRREISHFLKLRLKKYLHWIEKHKTVRYIFDIYRVQSSWMENA